MPRGAVGVDRDILTVFSVGGDGLQNNTKNANSVHVIVVKDIDTGGWLPLQSTYTHSIHPALIDCFVRQGLVFVLHWIVNIK